MKSKCCNLVKNQYMFFIIIVFSIWGTNLPMFFIRFSLKICLNCASCRAFLRKYYYRYKSFGPFKTISLYYSKCQCIWNHLRLTGYKNPAHFKSYGYILCLNNQYHEQSHFSNNAQSLSENIDGLREGKGTILILISLMSEC